MRPFVALYKAFAGGEWFRASLESVRRYTEEAVVIFSADSWDPAHPLTENCRDPLREFRAANPDYRVTQCTIECRRGDDQYRRGLEIIRERCGLGAGVLIVDTDEVWEDGALALLKAHLEANSQSHYFRSRLYSYLKSPLYRVWPTERPQATVALQDAREQPTNVRFATCAAGRSELLPDVAFHHYSYVRADEREIEAKFHNISTQEVVPSKAAWLSEIWPQLPLGANLHMTPGFERQWQSIKILTPASLPPSVRDLAMVSQKIGQEESRWRQFLGELPPQQRILTLASGSDRAMYAEELGRRVPSGLAGPLHRGLRTTYLEALWLMYWASEVPGDGEILEVGSGHGGSLTCLGLGSAPSVQLTSVDPFLPYSEQTHAGLVDNVQEGDEAAFWRLVDLARLRPRVRQIKEKSADAIPQLNDRLYDVVFIDACHSQQAVLADLRAYWPLVRPGGLLVGHDFSTVFPGVMSAAADWGQTFSTPVGTTLFYARKP